MRTKFFLFFTCLFILVSCGPDVVYEDKYTIDFHEWYTGDAKKFEFIAPKLDQEYDLYLALTHEESFPFENIYLKLKTHFPSGEIVEDQLSLELFGKDGQSRCSNSLCKLSALLQPKFKFKETGTHIIEIEQFTRRDTLPGVLDIGVSLVQVK